LAILLLCLGCSASPETAEQVDTTTTAQFTPAGHTTDSLADIKQRVTDDEAVMIDVREQREWDAGHLRDATLVPLSLLNRDGISDAIKQQLPLDKPIYLHCASGRRVLQVAEMLKPAGYDVRPLKAGYKELVEQGYAADSE
jgi:rhodanese-related sulfurtransferase